MDAIKVKLIGLSRGGGGNLQPDKAVTPTEQEQTVRPDPGYDGFRQVTVEAIPDQYADVSGVDAGAGDVRVGKVIVGSNGEPITGTMPPQKPEEIGHATPTEQAQTVTPTAGSVFSAVEVGAIPSEYADVSGVDATAADVRTGKIIVDAQGDTITGEMEPQKPEQVKSATPTTSPQSVTPDTGYALSRVDVGAIPSEYADVSDVTATAGTVLTGSDFVDASGSLVHGACDFDADTSDADATAGQIEAGATAYVNGAKVTGTKPIRTTDVEIDSLSPVPIPAGSYDGTVYARLADPTEVDPQYIAQGHSILGVQGSLVAQDNLPALLRNTLTSVSDATITAIPIYQFYSKTSLITADFPNVQGVGERAFYGCSSLTAVNMPLLKTIGTNAFQSCSNLASIATQNVTNIGIQAFKSCSSLPQSMEFPNVTTINGAGSGGGMFNNSSVRRIAFGALTDTRSHSQYNSPFVSDPMETLIFDVLTIIGTYAFRLMAALTTFVIRADAVCVLSNINAFDGTPFASNGAGGTLYIKKSLYDHLGDGTADDYLSATNWSVVFSANPNNQILPIEGSPYEVTT